MKEELQREQLEQQTVVERIMAARAIEENAVVGETQGEQNEKEMEYLCKWRATAYSDSTWERYVVPTILLKDARLSSATVIAVNLLVRASVLQEKIPSAAEQILEFRERGKVQYR